MRKILLLLVVGFLCTHSSLAQFGQANEATSEKEYLYISKGYLYQTGMGLNVKTGYSCGEDKLIKLRDGYELKFREFYRIVNDSIKHYVGSLVTLKTPTTIKRYCLPTGNNLKVQELYVNDFGKVVNDFSKMDMLVFLAGFQTLYQSLIREYYIIGGK